MGYTLVPGLRPDTIRIQGSIGSCQASSWASISIGGSFVSMCGRTSTGWQKSVSAESAGSKSIMGSSTSTGACWGIDCLICKVSDCRKTYVSTQCQEEWNAVDKIINQSTMSPICEDPYFLWDAEHVNHHCIGSLMHSLAFECGNIDTPNLECHISILDGHRTVLDLARA